MAASESVPPRLVAGIGLFVLLGAPLVAYLWDTLNRLFAGIVEPLRLIIAVPAAILFYLLLRAMARAVQAWQAPGSTRNEGTSR